MEEVGSISRSVITGVLVRHQLKVNCFFRVLVLADVVEAAEGKLDVVALLSSAEELLGKVGSQQIVVVNKDVGSVLVHHDETVVLDLVEELEPAGVPVALLCTFLLSRLIEGAIEASRLLLVLGHYIRALSKVRIRET